jgi:hypothetical protein
MELFVPLGENAQGTIQAGPDQQQRLDELCERLHQGEFHVETTETIPFMCIDGRSGARVLAPNTAGGTLSLYVADDLTTQRVGKNLTTVQGFEAIVQYIIDQSAPVGGHTDDHAGESISGCGANDKLSLVYDFIAAHGKSLRRAAAAIGFEPDHATRKRIIAHALKRQQFSAGGELLTILRANAPADHIAVLQGAHQEVAVIINKRVGTTLDREKLAREFGPNYQAFNVDTWSFEEAARQISFSEEEILQKMAAMVYYNLATAYVLCGPDMRVMVLE